MPQADTKPVTGPADLSLGLWKMRFDKLFEGRVQSNGNVIQATRAADGHLQASSIYSLEHWPLGMLLQLLAGARLGYDT
jgi:hypothetical protein